MDTQFAHNKYENYMLNLLELWQNMCFYTAVLLYNCIIRMQCYQSSIIYIITQWHVTTFYTYLLLVKKNYDYLCSM